jgi:hypothetical protein
MTIGWVDPPLLAVGSILTADDWNTVAEDLELLDPTQPGYIGTSGIYSAPTAGEFIKIGALNPVLYTPGGLTVTYPTAYPNGTDAVLFTALQTTPITFSLVVVHASYFDVQCWLVSGGEVGSNDVAFEWVAFGH